MPHSHDYQPLASYGPAENLACRETIFDPEVTANELRMTARTASQLPHAWPGFQLVLLTNDGQRGRGLSIWQNQQTLENYIQRHQNDVHEEHERVGGHEVGNPWATSVTSHRIGTVDIYLTGTSMPTANRPVFEWCPPGALRIDEMHDLGDLEALRNWWPTIASPTAPRSLARVSGFQFFAAVRYPDNLYTTYLGFRTQDMLDAYAASDLHTAHHGPLDAAGCRINTKTVTYTGQLLACFMRSVSSGGRC